MNSFIAILEFCAFYIEYKKVKFTAINLRGRTNVYIFYANTAFAILYRYRKSFFPFLVKNNY